MIVKSQLPAILWDEQTTTLTEVQRAFSHLLLDLYRKPRLSGVTPADLTVGKNSLVQRVVHVNWVELAQQNLYWKEGDRQIVSQEGDTFLLQALLCINPYSCPLPWTQAEAWQFANWLYASPLTPFGEERDLMPVTHERRLAALRRRIKVWLETNGYEAFQRALSQSLHNVVVSKSTLAYRNVICKDHETYFYVHKLEDFCLNMSKVSFPESYRPLISDTRTEIEAIINKERTGMVYHKNYVAIYLPSYVEYLWDSETSTPWFDWERVCNRDVRNLRGFPIPIDIKTDLVSRAKAWLGQTKFKLSEEKSEEVWKTALRNISFDSNFCVVLTLNHLVQLAHEDKPLTPIETTQQPRKVRVQKVRELAFPTGAQGTRTGNIRWHLCRKGVFIDPTSLRFTSLEDMHSRFTANVETPLDGHLQLRKGTDITSPKELFRKYCYSVNSTLFVHVSLFIDFFKEINPLFVDTLTKNFHQDYNKIKSKSREQEVTIKRANSIPTRGIFPFSLEEDTHLWSTYRRYGRALYWKDTEKLMPRHSSYQIKNRARFLLKCKHKNLTLEQARDSVTIEKVLGKRVIARYQAILKTE